MATHQLHLLTYGLTGPTPPPSLPYPQSTSLCQRTPLTRPQTPPPLLHFPPAALTLAPEQTKVTIHHHPLVVPVLAKAHHHPPMAALRPSCLRQSPNHQHPRRPVHQSASAAPLQGVLANLQNLCVTLKKTRHQTSTVSFIWRFSLWLWLSASPFLHSKDGRRRHEEGRGLVSLIRKTLERSR